MYLWKCWRDARLSLLIYFVPLLLAVVFLIRYAPVHVSSHFGSAENFVSAFMEPWTIFLGFVAWAIGGDGIGRTIGEDSGAYVLTRPRRRRFFLWSDVGFSFGLLTVIASMTVLLLELVLILHLVNVSVADPAMRFSLALVPLCCVVYAGLIYSTTYLCALLVPTPNLARVVSLLVFLTYALLHVLSERWFIYLHPFLPSWKVTAFPDPLTSIPPTGLWLSVGGRALAILLLLFVAHLVLERREIRA